MDAMGCNRQYPFCKEGFSRNLRTLEDEWHRFSKKHFREYVDYWVTFNEPHIFVILSHCSGTWPPGNKPSKLESLYCFTPWGQYGIAMREITEAHKLAYKSLHDGWVSHLFTRWIDLVSITTFITRKSDYFMSVQFYLVDMKFINPYELWNWYNVK